MTPAFGTSSRYRRALPVTVTGLLALTLAACGTTVPLSGRAGSGATGDLAGGGAADPTTSGGGTGSTGLGTSATSGTAAAGSASSGPAGSSSGGSSDGGAGGVTGTPSGVAASGQPAAGQKVGGSTSGKPTATKSASKSAAPTGKSGETKSATGAQPAAPTVANGPGVTATTISVGYFYTANGAAEQAALGSNIDEGDTLGDAKADVAYINAHGGLGDRTLILEPLAYDSTTTDSTSTTDQSICSHFTEDVKVFAVLVTPDVATATCLAKSGVEPIGTGVTANGAQDFASVPTYVDAEDETPQAAMNNLVDALAKDGYLTTKWDINAGAPGGALPVKVGVILPNLPRWEDAVTNELLPGLKAHGITVDPADVVEYQFPESNSDDGTAVADIQSAVVKFRGDNVTNVIPVEVNALGFFSVGSNSQKYYPRFGLSSATEAETLVTSGVVPTATLAGAVGFGWTPLIDLTDASHYPGASLAQCEKIDTDAGYAVSDNTSAFNAGSICDNFFLLQRGIAGLGTAAVTDKNVTAAIEQLGGTFSSAVLPTASYSPGKHFPVASGYPYGYNAGCTCMLYTGSAYPLR